MSKQTKEANVGDDEELTFQDDSENPSNQLLDFEAMKSDGDNAERPLPTSPQWHDYVMSQFTDEEILKEKNSKGEFTGKVYPSIYGLRRVAELLLGEIVENQSTFIEMNPGFAVAECRITFNNYGDGNKMFSDVGNCSTTTKAPYDAHLPSIAATRAEGRALRKALKLRTVSAEEMSGGLTDVNNSEGGGSSNLGQELNETASGAQHVGIKKVCERNGVDLDKFVAYFRPEKPVENWSGEDARSALSFLHSYQAKKAKLPDSVLITTKENF